MTDQSLNPLAGIRIDDLDKPIFDSEIHRTGRFLAGVRVQAMQRELLVMSANLSSLSMSPMVGSVLSWG